MATAITKNKFTNTHAGKGIVTENKPKYRRNEEQSVKKYDTDIKKKSYTPKNEVSNGNHERKKPYNTKNENDSSTKNDYKKFKEKSQYVSGNNKVFILVSAEAGDIRTSTIMDYKSLDRICAHLNDPFIVFSHLPQAESDFLPFEVIEYVKSNGISEIIDAEALWMVKKKKTNNDFINKLIPHIHRVG